MSLNLSLPLEKIYGYDPAEGLSEEEQQYLLGVQANLWTEFVATEKRVSTSCCRASTPSPKSHGRP